MTISALGVSNVASSKFQEYRDMPKGVAIPFVNLFSTGKSVDFNLQGYNVRQGDQRYTGWFNTSAFGLSFDYNQIPHNMGNDAHVDLQRTRPRRVGDERVAAPGARGRRSTPRRRRAGRCRSTTRCWPRPSPAPTAWTSRACASAAKSTLDLGEKLPIDLAFTYMRERKSGYRGAEGGGLYSAISSVVEVPGPLDELTQDFGVRAAYNFKAGNVHAAFNRNLYNNEAETLTDRQPVPGVRRAVRVDAVGVGGGSRGRWINAPDNEASTGSGRLPAQVRAARPASAATWRSPRGRRTRRSIPYTINSTILTPTGARADSLSTLQQSSFDGKINTTTMNFTFSSRPVKGLGLRARVPQLRPDEQDEPVRHHR